MCQAFVGRFALVALLGAAVLGHANAAAAFTCASPRQVTPLIVERQIRSTEYARVLTAYRPGAALAAGSRYRLEAEDTLQRSSRELEVVEPAITGPALPLLAAVDFSVHEAPLSAFNARFTFEPFEGNLVVDPDGSVTDPFEGLEITRQESERDDPIFYLAKEPCYANFAQAT